MKSSLLVAAATTSCAHAFVSAPASSRTPMSALNMGLFDGVKEAFGADGMGELDSERETPIDRWMGWNTKSTDAPQAVSKGTLTAFFSHVHVLLSTILLTWIPSLCIILLN